MQCKLLDLAIPASLSKLLVKKKKLPILVSGVFHLHLGIDCALLQLPVVKLVVAVAVVVSGVDVVYV